MKLRNLRRFKEEKYKKRCRNIIRNKFPSNSEELANNPKFVGKMVRNRTQCSCFMCGNPRKYYNQKTVRERRQEQKI